MKKFNFLSNHHTGARLGGGLDNQDNSDEKKKILIAIVGVVLLLIVTIGASYAYFTSNISSSGNNQIDATTVVLASARMDYGDKVVANGILPGNKILKTITVTGSGPDNAVPISATIILTPDVTNFGTHVKYTIYAVENSTIDPSTICESPKPTTENGMYYDAMECDTTELGTPIISGTFEEKKTVTKEIEVTSTTNTTYYLLIEYENDPNGQDEEQGKVFTINLGFQATYEGPRIQQSFIVDGAEVTDLPKKEEYYEVAVTCSDNKPRTWNYETWSLNIESDLEESCSCSMEFKKSLAMALKKCNKYAATCLIENSEMEQDELAYDGTADNNLRYIGANPNNYVCLEDSGVCTEDQLYRIIGVMPTQSSENGEYENRVKLIKAASYGNIAWHTSQVNDWATSSLKNTLNTTYWDSISEYQKYIDDTKWYLGGYSADVAKPSELYISERGNSVSSGRPTSVVAKVGLMYPSDYGYAAGGNTCRSLGIYSNAYNSLECYNNNWLCLDEYQQWTIMPKSDNTIYAVLIYGKNNRGKLFTNNVMFNLVVRPVFYLKSNVEIIADENHNGSSSKPFGLKLS